MARSVYTHLQLAGFRIRTDQPWEREMYVMRFPEEWKKPLSALARTPRDASDIRPIPIARLNRILRAVVQDVIAVATKATVGQRPPWLYSDVEVDREALFAIVAAWIRASHSDVGLTAAIIGALKPTDLQWEPVKVNFAGLRWGSQSDDLGYDELLRLLPHVLAAELTKPGRQYAHLQPRKPGTPVPDDVSELADTVEAISVFRRCPEPEGAAIMNWPPHKAPRSPFSYFARMSAHSRAFDLDPRIHLSVGARRWAHKEPRLSFTHDHSVYMIPELPWLDGLNLSRSFLVADIEAWKRPTPDDDFEYSARWADRMERIFHDLGLTERLPSPEQLKSTPDKYVANARAGLVFRNGMYGFNHPVAPGASLADKVPLIDWFRCTLQDHLELMEPLPRGTVTAISDSALDGARFFASAPADLRRAIATAVGSELGIDIYWDTTIVRNDLCVSLAELLGITIPESSDPAGTKTYTIPTAELTIRLTLQPVGQWAASLAGDESITGHRERFQAAVLSRAESIEQTLPHAQIPTIALAEIKPRGHYTGRQRAADPKFAVKTGLLQTGRLARCITAAFEEDPDTKAKKQVSHHDKALNSWYKLLRLLGVRLADIALDANLHGIDQPPAYLAFWLIRQNQHGWEGITRQVPVAVLIDPTGRSIQACAPKVGWMPLHQAQREISRHHMLTDQKRSPEEITRFFENVFKSVASVHPSLLLLTCAQNQRWGLPFLNNLKMEPDTIQFGQKPVPITRFPNVRHVRIRTTERDEVPDTYAINQTTAGHAPGYWIASERTYFSTGEKPHSASKAIKSSSKVASRWKKDDLIKPSPKGQVWNARGLELSVAAIQPDDEPEAWAALTHDLRWAAPHYKYATTLPWPLLIAKQLGQFIMPIELLEEIDDAETEASEPATDND